MKPAVCVVSPLLPGKPLGKLIVTAVTGEAANIAVGKIVTATIASVKIKILSLDLFGNWFSPRAICG